MASKQYGGSRLRPAGDCPPEMARRINVDFERCKQLAMRGLWCQAHSVFHALQMACLEFQPNTLDPYETPLADHAELSHRVRARLASIGVFFIGQLEAVSEEQLRALSLTPQSLRQLRRICRMYKIKLTATRSRKGK